MANYPIAISPQLRSLLHVVFIIGGIIVAYLVAHNLIDSGIGGLVGLIIVQATTVVDTGQISSSEVLSDVQQGLSAAIKSGKLTPQQQQTAQAFSDLLPEIVSVIEQQQKTTA